MRKLPEITDFKHIGIIQTAFLGDVALVLPLVQIIREIHPRVQITFVTTPASAPLVSCAEAVDNVISFDKRGLQTGFRGIKFIAKSLMEKGVDCIIAPHKSLRSSLISYITKSKYSVTFNKTMLSILFTKKIKYINRMHEIERNISLLKAFNTHPFNMNDLPKVVLDISDEDKSYIESRLNWSGIGSSDTIAVIAPGSVWETKKWKKEHFIELAKRLKDNGLKPVIIGSSAEAELCNSIALESNSICLAGETTIPQLLYLFGMADITITNDSAPTHLAGLMDCPVITIYGPTSPIFGFGPRGVHDKVAYHKLKCSPCAIHGGNKCPIKTHECMTGLMPEEVYDLCREVLRESAGA